VQSVYSNKYGNTFVALSNLILYCICSNYTGSRRVGRQRRRAARGAWNGTVCTVVGRVSYPTVGEGRQAGAVMIDDMSR
jgi:hypothetical protein